MLDLYFEHNDLQVRGDRTIGNYLFVAASQCSDAQQASRLFKAAHLIKDALVLAPSIDYLLDAHKDDQDIQQLGKVSIVRAILRAEQASSLYFDRRTDDGLDFRASADTWLSKLFRILVGQVSKTRIEDMFGNLSIITFNYDRTIETFLAHALQRYFDCSKAAAEELVENLDVHHVYGSVGAAFGSGRIPFGADIDAELIGELSKNIRTFTQNIDDPGELQRISQRVFAARRVIFLGFSFQDQNVRLLATNAPAAKETFATAYQISVYDQQSIQRQLSILAGGRPSEHLFIQGKCSKMLSDLAHVFAH